MSRSKSILIKRLSEETHTEFQVRHIVDGDGWEEIKSLPVHRDDCYLFIIIEQGEGEMEVDFHPVSMAAPHLCIVRPGQVHHNIKGRDCRAWVVRLDSGQIPDELRGLLDDGLRHRQHFGLTPEQTAEIISVLTLAGKHQTDDCDRLLRRRTATAILNLFVCQTVARVMADTDDSRGKHPRRTELCNRFKRLLSERGAAARTPSQCAAELCVSETYLNEVVKKMTGFTVSYWIRDNIMLEAKRLLCYTPKTVKEIAFATGYEDPAYFTKLFRKHTGTTPAAFRAKYRE